MSAPLPAAVTVQLPYVPRGHQREAHALLQLYRFAVLVWHRRAGKTVFAIVELLLAAAATTKVRARFGYIAPLLKQSKAVAWDYLKAFALLVPGAEANESDLSVTLPNGARIRLYGADNPDALRGGYFDGVVLDEVADMRPHVWGEVVRAMLADRGGWALFIGTPKGLNLFSELYFRAQKEEGWAADLKRAADTGAIPEAEIEQARREMTPAQFAQEFECDFAAAVDDVLIRLDDVLAAQRRSVLASEYFWAPKVLGVDCARYGDDRSCIFPRQGVVAMRPRVLAGLETMALAGQVAHTADQFKPIAIFIDVGGLGAGVFDRVAQLGFPAVPVDFGGRPFDARFENKRAEMWSVAADWVRGGGCLPESQDLAQELAAPRITYANKRGRMQLESKDDMRARGLRSPDIADAFVCTFASPVAAPEHPDSPTRAGSNVSHDFDPYER